jgi:2'-5' RNA ligase
VADGKPRAEVLHRSVSAILTRGLSALRRVRLRPTALLVPVPEAEPVLERAGVTRTTGLPTHVTLLFPFRPAVGVTPAVAVQVRSLCAGFRAFPFRLASMDRFPGVLYLVPEPAAPFRALIDALLARWPDCRPYEGAFDEVVPHLTVIEGPEPEGLVGRISALLPIEAQAQEVWLVRPTRTGRWELLGRFPLFRTTPD